MQTPSYDRRYSWCPKEWCGWGQQRRQGHLTTEYAGLNVKKNWSRMECRTPTQAPWQKTSVTFTDVLESAIEKKLRRQWKPLPAGIKEKEPLWYSKTPSLEAKISEDHESGGLQAQPETGSWWELILVLERALLIWTHRQVISYNASEKDLTYQATLWY